MKLLAFAAVAQVANSQFPSSFSFDTSNYQSASSGFSSNYGNFAPQQTSNFQGSPFVSSSGFSRTPSTAYGSKTYGYGNPSYNNVPGTLMYPGAQNAAPVRSTSFNSPSPALYPGAQNALPQRPMSSSSLSSSSLWSPPSSTSSTASYSASLYPQSGSYQASTQATNSYKPPVFSADSSNANFVANSLASMSQPKPKQMYKATFTELAPSKNEMKADDAGNEKIFNPLTVRRYNLILSATDKAYLDNDPSKEDYVPCDIITDYGTAEATTFYGAGCRYKGSLGSLMLCMDPETRKPMAAAANLAGRSTPTSSGMTSKRLTAKRS